MFFRKCKKCGGKLVLVDANIEVDIGGKTQKVKNVPAKQCTECRNLVVNEYVIERIKQYQRKARQTKSRKGTKTSAAISITIPMT